MNRTDSDLSDHLKTIYYILVDFQRAFDCVNRDMLFYKLLQNNIDGKMYQTLKAIYTLTKSCVKINDKLLFV